MSSYKRYILGVTLFLMLAMSSADIHCKMKSGCFAQCDPIGWNNIEEHLFNKEFSITCRNSESESLQKDIADLKLENKALQLESIKLEIEMEDFKLSTLKMRERHEEEIESLKTYFEKLQQENVEMKIENKNLKDSSTKMQEKYNEDIADLKISVDELKQDNKKLLTLTQAKKKCPMMYENKCFFVVTTRDNANYAQKFCIEKGGNLANIYDENHLNMIMTYARSKFIEKYSMVDLWLGMTYNTKNGKVFLSNGTEAKYVRWWKGFPKNISDTTAILLSFDESPTTDYQYMSNYNPDVHTLSVCEI